MPNIAFGYNGKKNPGPRTGFIISDPFQSYISSMQKIIQKCVVNIL